MKSWALLVDELLELVTSASPATPTLVDTALSGTIDELVTRIEHRAFGEATCGICGEDTDAMRLECCGKDVCSTCLANYSTIAGKDLKCPYCKSPSQIRALAAAAGVYHRRKPSYDEPEAVIVACVAKICRCPLGRTYARSGALTRTSDSRWELLKCRSCGSCGEHHGCAQDNYLDFVCAACEPAAGPRRKTRPAVQLEIDAVATPNTRGPKKRRRDTQSCVAPTLVAMLIEASPLRGPVPNDNPAPGWHCAGVPRLNAPDRFDFYYSHARTGLCLRSTNEARATVERHGHADVSAFSFKNPSPGQRKRVIQRCPVFPINRRSLCRRIRTSPAQIVDDSLFSGSYADQVEALLVDHNKRPDLVRCGRFLAELWFDSCHKPSASDDSDIVKEQSS